MKTKSPRITSVSRFAVLCVLLASQHALSQSPRLVTTFTNPAPAMDDVFGASLAAVGNDRVLIGAAGKSNGVGVVYLFSTNGTLLTTFNNPTAETGDEFGNSLAAVGPDRVLIGAPADSTGAPYAGAAYLFNTNGTLLTTFTNPTPMTDESFGSDLAAAGSDRVLIGAQFDDAGGTAAGAVYLFSTNGALLTTFTNPTPALFDRLGRSVAALGNDRVLVSAPSDDTGAANAGAVYLFRTNGTLLMTFANPSPVTEDGFGYLSAVGSDRVLIGVSPKSNYIGAAYLFRTNGTLQTTFTNPTPALDDQFGRSVAAVGSERVLIGAPYDDTGAESAGSVYLFSTNGTLLATVNNPTPADEDDFGISVAAVGSHHVLIGAEYDDTGATNAGAAYLFSLVPPLTISRTTTNTVVVSWPQFLPGFTLQQNTNGIATVNWSNAPGTIQDDGSIKTLVVNPPMENRFYRLFKP